MYTFKSVLLTMTAISTIAIMQTATAQNSAPNPAATERAPRAAPAPMPMDWVPKKTSLTPYVAPNKPIWRLSEILASHPKTASWDQPIVRNKEMWADYHQLAAGSKTPRVNFPDNRIGMIVWGG